MSEIVSEALRMADLPALLHPLAGGLFAGLTTTPDGTHHAVVLLADRPDAGLTWDKAVAWADEVGGVLPTRPVATMLLANAKDEFAPDWHWTCEAYDRSSAWFQNFLNGSQLYTRKSYEGRCRAVRLIQLTA